MKTVRRHVISGPCLVLGELVKDSNQFWYYRPTYDANGERKPRRLRWVKKGLVHVDPCPRCKDYPV